MLPGDTELARKARILSRKKRILIRYARRARALRERASRTLPRGDMLLRAERSALGTALEPLVIRPLPVITRNVRSAR
jgi:hypothetical protein